jgi:hypothetical protein
MNRSLTNSFNRREFLKSTGFLVGTTLTGLNCPQNVLAKSGFEGDRFIQQIDEVRLYMTHYAYFEEPDDDIPPALYFDSLNGQPTNELTLVPPVGQRSWFYLDDDQGDSDDQDDSDEQGNRIASMADFYKPNQPYILGRGNSPDFPRLVPPVETLLFFQQVLGGQVPLPVIQANTRQFLMALGNFLDTTPARGKLKNSIFRVIKDVGFVVQLKLGFLFQPPAGLSVPSVGILLDYVKIADLHTFLGEPPPATGGDQRVTYSWRATMELSTENRFIRQTATEPLPQGDPFAPDLTEIRMEGSRVRASGRYAIVGSVRDPEFSAPEVLLRVIFGTPTLTGIEFAIREEGFLKPT